MNTRFVLSPANMFMCNTFLYCMFPFLPLHTLIWMPEEDLCGKLVVCTESKMRRHFPLLPNARWCPIESVQEQKEYVLLASVLLLILPFWWSDRKGCWTPERAFLSHDCHAGCVTEVIHNISPFGPSINFCIFGIKWQCWRQQRSWSAGWCSGLTVWKAIEEIDATWCITKPIPNGPEWVMRKACTKDTDVWKNRLDRYQLIDQVSYLALLLPVQSNGTVGIACVHNVSQCGE